MWMLLVLACASDDGDKNGEDTQPFMPPDSLGLYSVSTQSVEVMSRHGFELPTQVWYPTKEESDDLHVYGDIKESPMAIDDADPDCSQIRPVVAFSHGNTGMRFQSYFFGEYLASHGYIVIAPDHVGNTIFDNDETRKPELILRRPEDISDSVDWLFDSEDFKNCVDPDAGFAVAGHSFGGYTTIAISGATLDTEATAEFCANPEGDTWLCNQVAELAEIYGSGKHDRHDERVWAGIPMTPAALETLIGGIESVSVPTMVLGGNKDTLTPMDTVVTPIFDRLTAASRLQGEILGAGHYSFTNACDLVNSFPDCGEDFLSPSETQQLVNTATVAYLGWLQGDERMTDYVLVESEAMSWTDSR